MAKEVVNFLGKFAINTISVGNFAMASNIAAKTPLKPTTIVNTAFILTILQSVESYIYNNYVKPEVVSLVGDNNHHREAHHQEDPT